jgi:preprotein translocase subunit SecG
MDLIIGLLTFVLVLNSLFLILLILIQLPKKEAGLGLAFGAAATDALFGAGSGTVLTRLTKYGTGIFLGLSLFLAILQNHRAKSGVIPAFSKASAPAVPATVTPTNVVSPVALTPPSSAQPSLQPATGTNLMAPALQLPALTGAVSTLKAAATNLPAALTTNVAGTNKPALTPEAPGK